jgi:hypothetical protein
MALLDELGGRTCSTTSYLLKHHISVIEADFTAQASCFTEAVVGPDHPIVPLCSSTTMRLLHPTSTSSWQRRIQEATSRPVASTHEDGDGNPSMVTGSVDLGAAAVVQGLDLGSVFFYF